MSVLEKATRMARYCTEQDACDACPVYDILSAFDIECDFDKLREDVMDKCLAVFEAEKLKQMTGEDSCSAPDNVNHPRHYELPGGIECIDVLEATQGKDAVQAFCICNAMKYLYRHKRKNGLEDVKKAKWYIDKFIELEAESHGK